MNLPKRKHLRLNYYDYSKSGYYHVAVCTEGRKTILSKVGREQTSGRKIFQTLFYDEIIRNQAAYDEISEYIFENPMK